VQRAGALRFLPETGTATLASLYNYFCPLQKCEHKIRLSKDRRSGLGAHGAEKASPLLQRVKSDVENAREPQRFRLVIFRDNTFSTARQSFAYIHDG
jgi:stress response protein SCP2